MPLIALGLNHNTAPVEVREKLAFASDALEEALRNLCARPGVEEAAILSTCNRTELYCAQTALDKELVAEWVSGFHGLDLETLRPYLYVHQDCEAVRHMLRVASGLDSMVLGEPQILGQVKDAYQKATAAETAGKLLSRLFQHTFAVAKQVRTDTAIGSSPISVAFAAVSLAHQIYSNLEQLTALLIGAGETIELVARHLHQHGIGRIVVANRTVERALALAGEFNGYAIALGDIPIHLAEADIVVSSTASPLPILGKGTVEKALKMRKHRPFFMVDLAVPRDIEPQVGELDDVYLYTVDDLRAVIEDNLKSRREAAQQAEEIIDLHVDEFQGWLRSLSTVNRIRLLREQTEKTRDEVLNKATRLLRTGREPEEALRFLAHTLTNKLLHTPSSQIRQAGCDDDQALLQAADKLFQLNPGKKQP